MPYSVFKSTDPSKAHARYTAHGAATEAFVLAPADEKAHMFGLLIHMLHDKRVFTDANVEELTMYTFDVCKES